jgi:GH25 family lysozyme M1 (1,4-beta-N-acetylmuramidase)
MIAKLAVFAALVSVALAVEGVDLSEPASSTDFACLKTHGYSFAVVRAYEQVNAPDSCNI